MNSKICLKSLRNDLNSMHWSEHTEILLLALMLGSIPISSGLSLCIAFFELVNIVVKNTVLKRWSFFTWHQDKSYSYSNSWIILLPMIAYWFIYLLSMFWTENVEMGWVEIGENVWFLIFPLGCAMTDFRQFNQQILGKIFWLYVTIMMVLFGILLTIVIVKACRSWEYTFLWYLLNAIAFSSTVSY